MEIWAEGETYYRDYMIKINYVGRVYDNNINLNPE